MGFFKSQKEILAVADYFGFTAVGHVVGFCSRLGGRTVYLYHFLVRCDLSGYSAGAVQAPADDVIDRAPIDETNHHTLFCALT
jgi:hypothetical protein